MINLFFPVPGLPWPIVMNLLCAVLLGGLVGIERSTRGRQAGMRTYAIVSLAAACLMSAISQEASAMSVGDPASRVIQGLLTGLGFLGAGVIMQDGLNIKGLTTAASIWLTSGIGIMCGLGQLSLAAFSTFLALSILAGLKHVENRIPKDHYAQVNIKLPANSKMSEMEVKAILIAEGLRPLEVAFKRDAKKRIEFDMMAIYSKRDQPNKLAQRLIAMNGEIEAFEISSSPE
jgi:putative Mg2+ transporter-C (MgtC) family protein